MVRASSAASTSLASAVRHLQILFVLKRWFNGVVSPLSRATQTEHRYPARRQTGSTVLKIFVFSCVGRLECLMSGHVRQVGLLRPAGPGKEEVKRLDTLPPNPREEVCFLKVL